MSTPEQIAAGLRGVAKTLDSNVPLTRALIIVERSVKKETPVGRTGNLRRSITGRVLTAERGAVGTNSSYALAVHNGTGIYGPKKRRITPTNKKALFWKGASHPVRSIKGQRPNPYMQRGFDKARGDVEQDLAQFGLQLLSGIVT